MLLGEFLVAYLRRLGVKRLFGIPGDLVLRLFARLGTGRGLEMVTLSHEPAVGFAADGYARATGGIGVACVTYGAGGHNMVNPVAGSYAEHVPVLVISGGPGDEERKFGTLIHHQARTVESQLAIYRELTAAATLVDDPRTAAEKIDEVVRTMWREQRPGYLEIHRDMVEQRIPVPRSIREGRPLLDPERSEPRKVREAARDVGERLRDARRPIVIVGIEAHRFKAERDVLALCERIGAPVMTTMLSKGAIPMDHPLYMGVFMGQLSPTAIRDRVEEADLVLDLGSPPTDIGGSSQPLPPEKVVRAVDGRVDASFHTYTGVRLRDFVHALLREKIRCLGETVEYHDNLPPCPPNPGAGRPRARGTDLGGKRARARIARGASPITVVEVLRVLNAFLAERRGYVVVADSGDTLFAGLDVRIPGRDAYYAPGFYASMGFSVPAAIGIELGTRRRALVLCGDGAFQMTGPEVAHAPGLGVRPIVLVMNNGGWGIFRPVLDRHALLEIPPWPYAELARLWGGDGIRVETATDLESALEAAERAGRFSLIEVMIGRSDLSPLARKYIQFSSRQGTPPAPKARRAKPPGPRARQVRDRSRR